MLLLLLWVTGVFTLGTLLQPRTPAWTSRSRSDSVLAMLFGDSRQMFANHFFVKADVYFHSGFYPSIFDQARETEEKENHMAGEGHDEHGEKEANFLGPPADWVDRFGRHFRLTDHTHLGGAGVREILPWLKISAELDPHRVETYTVAAYWLRTSLGKTNEAEQFLREGLRVNPQSYEILIELGRLYYENYHDANRARNVWELAFRRWREREASQKEPNYVPFGAITEFLGNLERNEGHYAEAIQWFELAKTHAPSPATLQAQIEALRAEIAKPQPGQ
jgi:tetratricopeptide (TPR) repeat protein